MLKNYLMVFLVLSSTALLGQSRARDLPVGFFVPFVEPDATDVNGTPYLEDDWHMGTITTNTGNFDSLLLRYDVAAGAMQYQRGSVTLAFNMQRLKGFALYGPSGIREFRFIDLPVAKRKSMVGFYEVVPLGSENAKLLIKHIKNLYKADFGPYSVQERTEYRYEPRLYVIEDGKLKKVQLTNRFCNSQFGLSSEEVGQRLTAIGISLDE